MDESFFKCKLLRNRLYICIVNIYRLKNAHHCKINTDTPIGMRLVNEMKQHSKTVQFIDPVLKQPSSIPEGYVSLKEGFDKVREHVRSMYKKEPK